MSVLLRQAKPEDAGALSALASQTFRDGWAELITHPVAEAYVAQAFTLGKLAEEIADPSSYIVVAAVPDESLVGYARLTTSAKVTPDFVTGPRPILMQRLYIAGDYRGHGVADALLENCVREALRRGGTTLWLETEPANERAWRFYVKRGFVDVGETVYALPGAVNDRIRVLEKRIVPTVRPADVTDTDALGAMASVVFAATFGDDNATDLMAAYLEQAFHPATLAAELADPDNRFLLAVTTSAREEIIGYSKLSFAGGKTPECVLGNPAPIAELERFYVRHEWHGTGVADTLMEKSLEAARAENARTLWLGVYEKNARANRFYSRWGFKDVGEHVFLFVTEEQTDRVMVRSLELTGAKESG